MRKQHVTYPRDPRRLLGWVYRVQIPYEEALGGVLTSFGSFSARAGL